MFFRSWSWSCMQRSWSWSCYFGLGLKKLVLFTSLQGLRAGGACCPLPKNPTPPSALIFGPLDLIWKPLPAVFISPMHRGLDKTLVIPIFGAKECIRMQDFLLKIYKKNPRVPAAEGETFVRTHPRANLPDAGAPPLLLGWLRP